MKKWVVVLVVLAFAVPVLFSQATGKVNFSGTYNLNRDKSDFGQAPQGAPGGGQGQPPAAGQAPAGQPPAGGGQGGGGGMRGRMTPSVLKITQSGNDLTVDRIVKVEYQDDRVTTDKLTLDGKVCELPGFGDSIRKMTATWSADGTALTITSNSAFERNGNKFEMNTTEVWTLKDGALTINSTSTTPRGERKTVLAYDKAPATP